MSKQQCQHICQHMHWFSRYQHFNLTCFLFGLSWRTPFQLTGKDVSMSCKLAKHCLIFCFLYLISCQYIKSKFQRFHLMLFLLCTSAPLYKQLIPDIQLTNHTVSNWRIAVVPMPITLRLFHSLIFVYAKLLSRLLFININKVSVWKDRSMLNIWSSLQVLH